MPDSHTRQRWAPPAVAAMLVLLGACGQVTVPEPATLADPETTAPTTVSRSAGPTPGKDTDPIQLDFGDLERRPAPVAYWSARDQAIHDDLAGTVVPYRKEPLYLGTLTEGRVPSYAVIPEVDGAQVQLVGADGKARDLGGAYEDPGDLIVSPDRRKVGWHGYVSDDEAQLIVADVPSGRVLVEQGLGPVGAVGTFLSNDLVEVTSESAGSGDLEIVRISDRTMYSPDHRKVIAAAPDARLVVPVDPPAGEDGNCLGVYQLAQLAVPAQAAKLVRPRWQSCEPGLEIELTRPHGRYLVLGKRRLDRYTVVDLENKRRLLEVRADQLGALAWSDHDDQIVVEAWVGDQLALVTCDVAGSRAGSCGLSTDPRPSEPTNSWRHGPTPYVLAGDG